LPGHLAPGASETHGRLALPSVRPFTPRCDAKLLRPRLTSRSASRRRPFRRKARSPQVRARAFPAQPPDLRRRPFGRKSFAAICPLALGRLRLVSGSCSSAGGCAPRFLQRSPHGEPPCGSLGVPATRFPRGLAPPGPRSCWAHRKRAGPDGPALRVTVCVTDSSWTTPDRRTDRTCTECRASPRSCAPGEAAPAGRCTGCA